MSAQAEACRRPGRQRSPCAIRSDAAYATLASSSRFVIRGDHVSTETADLIQLRQTGVTPAEAPRAREASPDRLAHASASSASPRVLIVTENASFRFGGEAVLPLHYFCGLQAAGIPVWMITNARNRQELSYRLTPDEMGRISWVPDGPLHIFTARIARWLPPSFASFVIGQFISIIDQRRAARLARTLIAQHGITVVHQPVPVSPKHVSALRDLGVPVVMGPMNGGITYPPGFRGREGWFDRAFVPLGRMLAGLAHRLFPGKLQAAALLVANARTAHALPRGVRGKVEPLVENGVNLGVYQGAGQRPENEAAEPQRAAAPVRFAFAGRLVDWKGVDLLLEAANRARKEVPLTLEILGDGSWRRRLERQAAESGLADVVHFRGWMTHQDCAAVLRSSDVFILPSLRECGGAAVLEAMAMGLPVIATHWGGPADYLDATCGILVAPQHKEQFIDDLARAMVTLAKSPETRRAMGEAGYQKVVAEYDWRRKIERVTEIYREVLQQVRAG